MDSGLSAFGLAGVLVMLNVSLRRERAPEEKKPETQSTPTPPSAETKEIAENAKRYKEPEPLTEDPKSSEKPEPPTYEEVRSLAWQSIIFSEEAKRMKMEVSNDEVSREILKLFSSESGGFSPAFYQMWVKNQYRGRPREFEEAIRKYICARKIRETILKDVPAEEVEKRWMEWMMKTMGDAHFKDYTLQPSAE